MSSKKLLIVYVISCLIIIGLISCSSTMKNDELPVKTFISQGDEYLWWSTGNSLFQWSLVSHHLTEYEPLAIEHFFITDQNILWAYGMVIAFFDGDHWVKTNLPYKAMDMIQTNNGEIWVATSNGYYFWDEVTQTWSLSQVDLPGRTLIELSSGELLFGLEGEGIIHFDNNKQITHWTANNGLKDTEIWSLIVTNDNNILAGTRWDIYRWDEYKWHSIGDIIGTLDADGPVVYDLYQTRDNVVWAATTAGIGRLDDTGWEIFEWEICGGNIYEFVEVMNESFWVGCQTGLYRWDGLVWQEYGSNKGIADNDFAHVTQTPEGSLFSVTNSGMYKYDVVNDIWNILVEFE